MKKIKFFALAIFAMLGSNAFAAEVDYSADGLDFRIDTDAKTAKVIGVTEGATVPATLTIPETKTATGTQAVTLGINNLEFTIVEIAENAFKGKTAITKIELPKTVNNIDESAFEGLTGLTVDNFTWAPKTNSTIGKNAFKGCTKFAGAYALPKWVKVISEGAFKNTGLTALTLATNTKLDHVGAEFISGTSIEVLDFTKATTAEYVTFEDEALASDKLKKVIFADEFDEDNGEPTVQCNIKTGGNNNTISNLMFSGATALEEVVFPASLTTIAAGAFATSSKLKALDLSYTDVVVVEDLFQASIDFPRAALTSVKFSGNNTDANIKENAFAYCTGLTTITFPENWAANGIVKNNAFKGCTGLTTLTYLGTFGAAAYVDAEDPAPDKAGILEVGAFTGCKSGMAKINMNVKTAYYTAVDGETAAKVPACIKYVKTDEEAGVPDSWTINFPAGSNNQAFKCKTDLDWSVKAKDAIVYSVYVDQNAEGDVANDGYDGTIYIFPHKVVQGEYRVKKGEAVIIKSKGESTVTALTFAEGHFAQSTAAVPTELHVNLTANASINTIISDAERASDRTRTLWQGNIQNGVLGFAKPSSNTLAKGTYYVFSKKAYSSADRMRVVWVDEDDATAIQAIQNKAKSSNNAIYNLRGEKVNAAYKGLVIKNGKKYIQK